MARNGVFDSHLTPDWATNANRKNCSNSFYLRSSIVLTFLIPPTRCVNLSKQFAANFIKICQGIKKLYAFDDVIFSSMEAAIFVSLCHH